MKNDAQQESLSLDTIGVDSNDAHDVNDVNEEEEEEEAKNILNPLLLEKLMTMKLLEKFFV